METVIVDWHPAFLGGVGGLHGLLHFADYGEGFI